MQLLGGAKMSKPNAYQRTLDNLLYQALSEKRDELAYFIAMALSVANEELARPKTPKSV